ncbi:hypothetical protein [Xenorhabdus bovienii]|uniref:hypothetical protein n=1 Tax=Xenorhabdus bovienii TaxID=40576 RepID=UPI003B985718
MHGRFINGLVSLPNPTPLLRHFHFRPLLLQLFAGLDIGQCVTLTQRLTDKRLVRPFHLRKRFQPPCRWADKASNDYLSVGERTCFLDI